MIYFIILGLVLLVLFIRFINFKWVVNQFNNYNVLVGGLRGTGKDMLFANYIAYNKVSKDYISIVDYKIKNKNYIKLDLQKLDIKNNFNNFINGNINTYKYPYPQKAPIFLPDSQLYFPSAYQELLKKEYKGIVNFFPLSRHLGNTQIHCNSQNATMIWDKLRVQSDTYILCMSCRVFFHKLVFMNIRIYEKYDSFIARIPPYKQPIKLLGNKKVDINLHKISYQASYGNIVKKKLFFINRSKYNTRYFKDMLESTKEVSTNNLVSTSATKV